VYRADGLPAETAAATSSDSEASPAKRAAVEPAAADAVFEFVSNYKSTCHVCANHDAVVASYPDSPGAAFLQLPVDWLSRPLREMAFQSLVRRHDLANKALPFGSWPAGAQGIFQERFTFNRVVVASEAAAAVFAGGLHRMKQPATGRSRKWRPSDVSDEVRRSGVSGRFIARRYVDMPDQSASGYEAMKSVLRDAIAESRGSTTNMLLIPNSDVCPAFDGVLILGGVDVEVLFLQVTLQQSHGISPANTGARDFFEAALGVVEDESDAVGVALVYVLADRNYERFGAQEQAGDLANCIAQHKAQPTVVTHD
jgi:hypothetical protein